MSALLKRVNDAIASYMASKELVLPLLETTSQKLGYSLNHGLSLELLSDKTDVAICDLVDVIAQESNPRNFTVWVGDVEINEFLLTLDVAVKMKEKSEEDGYEPELGCYL